jgi:hypothetical protein
MKPVILLDVDGPLSPYDCGPYAPDGFVSHLMKPSGFLYGGGLKVRLNPLHGPSLASLGAELIWATMWNNDANVWIGPQLGLPELPYIPLTYKYVGDMGNIYMKTPQIADWMNENRPGVPFIWIDDEATREDFHFLHKNCSGYADLMVISAAIGLTDQDFTTLKTRVAELADK